MRVLHVRRMLPLLRLLRHGRHLLPHVSAGPLKALPRSLGEGDVGTFNGKGNARILMSDELHHDPRPGAR
jgi:hypothetical protein